MRNKTLWGSSTIDSIRKLFCKGFRRLTNQNWALLPFSLIRDFGKQNTRGNVSKISVSLSCYWQIGSKSTNYSPIAWRREGYKVTLVAAIGGFRSDLSITRIGLTEILETFPQVFYFPKSCINESGVKRGKVPFLCSWLVVLKPPSDWLVF